MRISFKSLALVLLIILAGYLLYIDSGKVTINWLNYEIVTSLAAVLMAILVIAITYLLYRGIGRLFYVVFSKINLNDTLADYIKHIELSNYFDKEIQLKLINDVTNLKILKIFVRLNELVTKKQYVKALKIIKRKQHKSNLKNLLNYTNVQIMLANKEVNRAAEFCIRYLGEGKKPAWALLKLLEISLLEEPNLERLKFLQRIINNKEVDLNKENYLKAYCLINYKLFELEKNHNSRELIGIIKKYPGFIPLYNLIIRELVVENKHKEAKEYLMSSWKYDITYENTISSSYFFKEEDKEEYLKFIKRLLSHTENSKLDEGYILLAIVNTIYGNFIEANDSLLRVKNPNMPMFRIAKLHLYLKENNVKDYNNFINDYVNNLKLRWWNEYILQNKP